MKNYLPLFVVVLALSTTHLLAQTGSAGAGTQANPGQGGTASETGHVASTQQNASSQRVDDDSLHRQVHEQLATNPDLQNIQISVHDGIVELNGTVPNKNDRKEAKRLAKAVPGVRKVRENLSINSSGSGATTASTAGGVSGATAGATGSARGGNQNTAGSIAGKANPSAPSTTTAGTMPQSGASAGSTAGSSSSQSTTVGSTPGINPNVGSSTQRDTTGRTTGSVAGTQGPNTTTGSAAGAQARTQPPVSPGGVAGANAPSQAGQTGSRASGSNVGAPAASQAGASTGSTGSVENNDEIRNDIQTAFRNEPALTSANVSVSVTDDTVTLNGAVPSGHDRETAERIAQSFAGNRRVMDNITVAGGGPPSNTPSQTTRPEGSSVPRDQQHNRTLSKTPSSRPSQSGSPIELNLPRGGARFGAARDAVCRQGAAAENGSPALGGCRAILFNPANAISIE